MKKGFTLIEVLIVVIILGILATIAVPQFIKTVERARRGEAMTNIGALQTGLRIYQLEADTFTTCQDDLDPQIKGRYWTYLISDVSANEFLITATRGGGGDYAGQTIIFNQDGNWTGNYEFLPKP